MNVKNGFFALLITCFTVPAFASITSIDPCHLHGKIVLDHDTTFVCDKAEQIIGSDVHIYTYGNEVKFRTIGHGHIIDDGMKIDVVEGEDASSPNGRDAALVTFDSESVSGTCGYIHNNGYKNGAGGAVVYKVLTFYSTAKGQYKCNDITTSGVGQGINAYVYADAADGKIPFSDFQVQVTN